MFKLLCQRTPQRVLRWISWVDWTGLGVLWLMHHQSMCKKPNEMIPFCWHHPVNVCVWCVRIPRGDVKNMTTVGLCWHNLGNCSNLFYSRLHCCKTCFPWELRIGLSRTGTLWLMYHRSMCKKPNEMSPFCWKHPVDWTGLGYLWLMYHRSMSQKPYEMTSLWWNHPVNVFILCVRIPRADAENMATVELCWHNLGHWAARFISSLFMHEAIPKSKPLQLY